MSSEQVRFLRRPFDTGYLSSALKLEYFARKVQLAISGRCLHELATLLTAPYSEYYLNPFKGTVASFAVEAIGAPVHDASELESSITALAHEQTRPQAANV